MDTLPGRERVASTQSVSCTMIRSLLVLVNESAKAICSISTIIKTEIEAQSLLICDGTLRELYDVSAKFLKYLGLPVDKHDIGSGMMLRANTIELCSLVIHVLALGLVAYASSRNFQDSPLSLSNLMK